MCFPQTHIKWIMIVSGLLTCTMVYAALAPNAALLSTFGDDLGDGPLAEIVVRNWGILITLVGGVLVYGAYRPEARTLALIIAAVSKLGFISLVASLGKDYLGQQAGIAVAIDALWVVIFGWYLAVAHLKLRQFPAKSSQIDRSGRYVV